MSELESPYVTDPCGTLSAREREVLAMASLGLTNSMIALRMQLTVHAVKFRLGSIYRKLGVTNRTEAAIIYVRASAAPLGRVGSD